MLIKLNKSFHGKKAGSTMEIEDKYLDYIIKNKIGEKVIVPEYETKEEKKAPRRRKKKIENESTDN